MYFFQNFSLKDAIRNVQENRVGLKLHGAHQFLAYDFSVNLFENNINTLNKNTQNSRQS
jgi:hypothetical protein